MVGWSGNVAHMGKLQNANNIVTRKPKEEISNLCIDERVILKYIINRV
jgi:hypothetical protein